jgi:DNA-binding FrmR family transcriptional regulator
MPYTARRQVPDAMLGLAPRGEIAIPVRAILAGRTRMSMPIAGLPLSPPGDMDRPMSHANDPELLKRIRRAAGHLAAVERMVAEGRDALLIAQQLQAVIRALANAKQAMILHHIDHHLADPAGPAGPDADDPRAAFRALAKYL